MKPLEMTGRTTDEAIEAALKELGLTRDRVDVEILQIETRGVLGFFGKRKAKVRVVPRRKAGGPVGREKPRDSRRDAGGKPQRRDRPKPKESREAPSGPKSPAPSAGARDGRGASKPQRPDARTDRPRSGRPQAPEGEPGEAAKRAAEVLKKISECFGVKVEVEASESPTTISLRVKGEDVGQLIGRRGRTLSSVQYVISRLVNEDRLQRKKVSIDVDGYSKDREQSLREMADRIRGRVERSGKPAALPPMNPQERRIVHMSLQECEEVATESVGPEGKRFVVAFPRGMSEEEVQKYIDGGQWERPSEPDTGGRRRGGGGPGRGPDSRARGMTAD